MGPPTEPAPLLSPAPLFLFSLCLSLYVPVLSLLSCRYYLFIYLFFFKPNLSLFIYLLFFFNFISQQCSVISLLTVSSQRSFFWLKLKICATNRKMVSLEEEGDHQTGCFNQCEGERSGRLTRRWRRRRRGFWWIVCETASVYPHLQIPWCLLSAFRPIFLHIVGNLSILAHGIIHSWPI